jgi:F-box protein 11
MRFTPTRIVIVSTVLLWAVALNLACARHSSRNAPKETPPPDTVIVSRNGDGQYTTIGEALKSVKPGMRILVRPGVYNEALIIDKLVEIVAYPRSAGEQVVLQTLNSSSITMRTDAAVVRGLTIRHRLGVMGALYNLLAAKKGPAVEIAQGELLLEDCDIISNSVAGIAIHGLTANPIIRRTRIHDGQSNGVWVYAGGKGTLEDCEISGTRWAAVRIEGAGDPVLRRCKLHDGENAGVVVTDGGLGTFEECEIWNNFAGFESRSGSKPVFRRTSIHDSKWNGVYIHRNSSGTIEDCQIFNNGSVGVQIKENSTPLVARSKIFNNVYSDLEISDGSDPTIKDCAIYGGQMSGIFVYEGGHGTIENCDIFGHTDYQEVVIKDGSDPTLDTCKIHHGKAGGVLLLENARGTFENCDIFSNAFSGVWIRTGSNPTIRNSKINRNDGVAVLSEENSAGSVLNCDLTGNLQGSWSDLAGSQLNRRGNVE